MSTDNDILLPDQPAAGDANTEKAKPGGAGKKRSARILKILTAVFLVFVVLVFYIFSGGDKPAASAQRSTVALNDAGTGEFTDSRLQDAFERQRREEERKRLAEKVQAGDSVARFQDAEPPAPSQSGSDRPSNLFSDIDRQAAEREAAAKQQAAEQARQQRADMERSRNQIAERGALSSRMPVPSEAGRNPAARPEAKPNPHQNGSVPANTPNAPSFDPAAAHAQTEAALKAQAFARLTQQMRGGTSDASGIPPAVYHATGKNSAVLTTDTEAKPIKAMPARGTGFAFDDEVAAQENESRVITLQQAGDLTTAWLEGRVDSDVPSAMVVVEVLEGTLQGARLLGTHSIEGECILIDFHTAQWRGREIDIKAAAADHKTGQTCVSGRVNYRAFQRYGVPVLFAVAKVGATYQRQKDTQTVTTQGWGDNQNTSVVEGGRSFSSIAKEEATDGALDALSDPVTRYANMPIQITKDQGVIGIRWLGRVEVDLSVRR